MDQAIPGGKALKMAKLTHQQRLARKNANPARVAADVIAAPEGLGEIFDGLTSTTAATKYGSAKVIRIVSEREPSLLLPHWDRFVEDLASDNNILRWNAILVIGNLAVVEDDGRIESLLDELVRPILGPDLITATNTMKSLASIVAAKPDLVRRASKAVMGVDRATYKTPMCQQIAFGHAIKVLDQVMPQDVNHVAIVRFVEPRLSSDRASTAKAATRFLKKWT